MSKLFVKLNLFKKNCNKNYFHCVRTVHNINGQTFKSSCGLSNSTKTFSTTSSNIFHKYIAVMDAPSGIFKGVSDRFNGITIDSVEENDLTINFGEKLEKSLRYWIENKKRGIWFKVHLKNSDWVPHLVNQGFDFHHAKNGFVVMCKWLPTNEYPNIPVYAHTMIGVGGIVINDKNEVLVVSDKYAMIPDSWKLPGGYVEPKEDLIDAAIREVREETGVETVFETIVSVRHSHGGGFGCSDIYVVIGLKPTTSKLIKCDREIEKVSWMPVQEYLNHPHVHETNRHFAKTFLDYKKFGIKIVHENRKHQILKKEYSLYFVKKDM